MSDHVKLKDESDQGRELGAFAHVDGTDAGDFIERLDRMHLLDGFRIYKAQSMEAMRLRDGSRAADIGCGAGDDAARLSHLVGPHGTALGIDLSEAMVAEAAARFTKVENLEFVAAPAASLPFADGTLDAIRADRVLIHVPDPEAAIGEMVRVLRPGGRIVLSEPDMVGFWVSSRDAEMSGVVSKAIAGSCKHPFLPRDMGVMLRDMGLKEVEHWAIAMVSSDFSTVNRVVQFELVSQALKAAGAVPADRMDDWWNDQLERNVAGRFCAGLNVMSVAATKP